MTFERRHLGGRAYALVATDLESRGTLAAWSERRGGASAGPFAGLNLSFSVGDDPRSVLSNRQRVVEGLGIAPFAVAGLVHGARLVRVGRGRAGSGFAGPDGAIAGADGLVSSTPGLSVAVTTADCLPIVLADGGRVAVVHAGWRGLAAGIVATSLAAFEEPSKVHAVVGPAIGPCHYEVEEDVALAVAAASPLGAVTRRARRGLFLDLPGTARGLLKDAGVRRIEVSDLCTSCHAGRFFSHRRDGPTGRQALVAAVLGG